MVQDVADRLSVLALGQRAVFLLAQVGPQPLQNRDAPLLAGRQSLRRALLPDRVLDVIQLGDQAQHVMHLPRLIQPGVEEVPPRAQQPTGMIRPADFATTVSYDE